LWCVALGDVDLLRRPSLGAAMRGLEYEICRRMIEQRGDLIVLHGATVFASDGAAFITGASNAGKSTLALALAARGYRVGGDDAAFLDTSTNEVIPIPRCAHLDTRSRRLLRAAGLRLPAAAAHHGFVTPADLGPPAPPRGAVRHLIITGRGSAPTPRITPIPQAAMVTALMHEGGWPLERAEDTLAALSALAGAARCYELDSGRLRATVDAVATRIGAP
jgi:hypothetical protein